MAQASCRIEGRTMHAEKRRMGENTAASPCVVADAVADVGKYNLRYCVPATV